MKGFRAEYNSRKSLLGEGDFILDVIGYRAPLSMLWKGMKTIPAHRLMIFHDPVSIDYGEEQYETQGESLIFFPAFEPVVYGRSDQDWTHSWIRFRGDYFPHLLRQQGGLLHQPLPISRSESWEPWLLGLYREMQRSPQADPLIITGLLQLWSRNLHFELLKRMDRNAPTGESDRLSHVKIWLESHYRGQNSTAYMAQMAGMGESYFCSCFKKRWGQTPLEYRLFLRIRQAKELLGETAFPIGQIGELCGFTDPFYFSKIFKRETGVSPKVYRINLHVKEFG